jgi:uncharacterized pyridoxamine 5'-phosphate oxidase family protein
MVQVKISPKITHCIVDADGHYFVLIGNVDYDSSTFIGLYSSLENALKEVEVQEATYPYDHYDIFQVKPK